MKTIHEAVEKIEEGTLSAEIGVEFRGQKTLVDRRAECIITTILGIEAITYYN